MSTTPSRRVGGLLVLLLATAGLVGTGSGAEAAPVTVNLCATQGSLSLPGPATPTIWGFSTTATSGDCGAATATLPGPVLNFDQGDVVTLNVTNALPGTRSLHFEIPGITFDPGPVEAASGATVAVTFTASAPGTYLYQSSGDAGRQTAMGLYGAMVVNSSTPNQAYGDATTAYAVQKVLVLSALDPDFNAAPDSFDLNDYTATYWMINGQSYPDTAGGINAAPNQRLLLRYVNAGFDNTTMALLGLHEHVVARDARLVPHAFDAAAETIPAGATEDAIVTMPASPAPPVAAGYALYNRQLHLTNGVLNTPTPAAGGMLTFIHP
jgi:FtsP/CotA-like multicopper oxidase with cupredoxin domain